MQPPTWPDGDRPKQMHLDVTVSDLDEAEARAVGLGATTPTKQPQPDRWRVLLDPAGHPFCLTTQFPRLAVRLIATAPRCRADAARARLPASTYDGPPVAGLAAAPPGYELLRHAAEVGGATTRSSVPATASGPGRRTGCEASTSCRWTSRLSGPRTSSRWAWARWPCRAVPDRRGRRRAHASRLHLPDTPRPPRAGRSRSSSDETPTGSSWRSLPSPSPPRRSSAASVVSDGSCSDSSRVPTSAPWPRRLHAALAAKTRAGGSTAGSCATGGGRRRAAAEQPQDVAGDLRERRRGASAACAGTSAHRVDPVVVARVDDARLRARIRVVGHVRERVGAPRALVRVRRRQRDRRVAEDLQVARRARRRITWSMSERDDARQRRAVVQPRARGRPTIARRRRRTAR